MLSKSAVLAVFVLCSFSGTKYDKVFILHATDFDLVNAPAYADLPNTELKQNTGLCLYFKGGVVPAQVENISGSRQRIWWIANLKAGESMKYKLRVSDKCHSETFSWNKVSEYSTRLDNGKQPVMQYEHPAFDGKDIMATHKAFHHVFDPEGNQLITKGLGGVEQHHKGIFFGYSQIYINTKKVNNWAAFDGERIEHAAVMEEFAGPVMGGHIVKIYWKDQSGEPFIEETREMRVFQQPKGESLIDFSSTLRSISGDIQLKGDRQHAGVQFRAAQYVADNRSTTIFIRPSDRLEVSPDVEIDGDAMRDMPWDAMNFKVEDRQYTVAYLTHPSNPGEAEMSERKYGRFGEYFPYMLTKKKPLEVKYRFWVKTGTGPSVESIHLRYKSYAVPPAVEIK